MLLAAIGACTSIYDLLVGFALGIGNGLAIVTARSFGSKDEKLLKMCIRDRYYSGGVLIALTAALRFDSQHLVLIVYGVDY